MGCGVPHQPCVKTLAVDGLSVAGVSALAVGVALGVRFVRRQRRLPDPMLDLRLFADRGFSISVTINLTMTFVYFGALFFATQYLQLVLEMRPLAAGLALVPGSVVTIVAGLVVVALVRRYTAASLIFWGLMTVAVGFGMATQVSTETGVLLIVGAFVLAGAGFGLVDTLTVDIIMTAAPPARSGAASAVSETAYELGAATGTAVLGSVLTAVYAAQLRSVPGVAEPIMDRARETMGAASALAGDIGGDRGEALRTAASSAFVSAVHVVALIGVVIAAVAAVQARRMLRLLGT